MSSVSSSSPVKKKVKSTKVFHLFRTASKDDVASMMRKLSCVKKVTGLKMEYRYNIEMEDRELTPREKTCLTWLLSETYEADQFGPTSFLDSAISEKSYYVEVGPRLSFTTAWSSNAVSICEACGLDSISRIERSRRYEFLASSALTPSEETSINSLIHDRMTEFIIEKPIQSFAAEGTGVGTQWVPVLKEGKAALREISDKLGLAFDDWDLEFYTKLFRDKLKRDPSDVECFDLAQSNSEHSRHWFFGGKMVIDGEAKEKTLFQLVKGTNPACDKQNPQENNSVIAFHDNSSAIRGFPVHSCLPNSTAPASPTPFCINKDLTLHGILTCETHNFPCGIAPFPGAETGTGGRIRDVHATGRGAHVVAGTSSYCVGNLNIPNYEMPWEDKSFVYPSNMASPLQIEIEASNGASDYGNKFGEPVICGYTRSFGMRLANGERREWIKPIMMSAGVGQLDARHVAKDTPSKGMVVTKLGGPAYRIGMGGGAASSRVHDAKNSELDFNAVQRGDAEMENKMNRVIRACIELGPNNPILSIHDQGAGGNGNVLKEIVEPTGAELYLRRLPVGDDTMTALELWGAEYQENCALLIHEKDKELFRKICERENMPFAYLGNVTGDGIIKVHDEKENSTPVDLDLEDVLGKMPQKTFESDHLQSVLKPLELNIEVQPALDRVLRLLQVGSKRFLTTKVDRSVTGLVAQQQCVGPLHTPLADVGVIAQSHFPNSEGKFTGVATAIGEQPIKGLICPKAMARMTVGEALTNLVFAKITALEDVKCSGNWMWAAKLPGEGAAMYDACESMCEVMKQVGIAVDGGKDSLSMAAKAGDEVVKCPGQLAISVYAMSPDVTLTVTPDLKPVPKSRLVHISVDSSKHRLGGSALAQVCSQLGDSSPDLENPKSLVNLFNATQKLIGEEKILAGHDISDGGFIVALLEMSFAGNVGFKVDLGQTAADPLALLFAEELGLVLQVEENHVSSVLTTFNELGVACSDIGQVTPEDKTVSIIVNASDVLQGQNSMLHWRDIWEATSFELDKRQANPMCVEQEQSGLKSRSSPPYHVSFDDQHHVNGGTEQQQQQPKVAILREEGSNGDREMASAFVAAGFEAWDVTVSDLSSKRISLDQFQGIVFVGGFSYADVLDSGKGWAGVIRFNEAVWKEFQAFYRREDTFSLGVCNGCQLMALLGWIPGNPDTYCQKTHDVEWSKQPRFIHNESGRYESRFTTVKIQPDNKAMMFKGMENSVLGVWIAHGEGRVHFPDAAILDQVLENGQAPLRYVDDAANETEQYPFNPNGSVKGITALTSKDGRHLALMPHPERVHRLWQWPWKPQDWNTKTKSPWMKMFENAYTWSCAHLKK